MPGGVSLGYAINMPNGENEIESVCGCRGVHRDQAISLGSVRNCLLMIKSLEAEASAKPIRGFQMRFGQAF